MSQTKCILVSFLDAGVSFKRQFNSLKFALRGALMKIINTKSKDVVCQCIEIFDHSTGV